MCNPSKQDRIVKSRPDIYWHIDIVIDKVWFPEHQISALVDTNARHLEKNWQIRHNRYNYIFIGYKQNYSLHLSGQSASHVKFHYLKFPDKDQYPIAKLLKGNPIIMVRDIYSLIFCTSAERSGILHNTSARKKDWSGDLRNLFKYHKHQFWEWWFGVEGTNTCKNVTIIACLGAKIIHNTKFVCNWLRIIRIYNFLHVNYVTWCTKWWRLWKLNTVGESVGWTF